MKKRRKLIVATPVLLLMYLVSPVLLQLFNDWDYQKNDIEHMEIIGHRGGASIGPENTLACFKKGIEAGADMIELDIHLTKDNVIVICHDETINRTTNGEGRIEDLTLDEIRKCKVEDADGNLIPT